MDSTVTASLIGAAAALIGVGGTVAVAITGVRTTRRTNQATIDAAFGTQFADRYSRAIEQVGSPNLDVRIGGIYALEGIAFDSPRHHSTVMEVLAAFIREHSRIPADSARPERWPPPDVHTALTVIGRRKKEHDIRIVDLTGADLHGADLLYADLSRVNLRDADLSHAQLVGASLDYANLWGTDLSSAVARGASLHRAILGGAKLDSADLTRANLTGADIHDAKLEGVNLTDARWPDHIRVPEGWTSVGDTGRLRRAGTGPDAITAGTPLQGPALSKTDTSNERP
jgi:uncharacterized protein YjbI with pentapeptide repeats